MKPPRTESAQLMPSAGLMVEMAVPAGAACVGYDPLTDEATRRAAWGLGAIDRRGLLEALASLPLYEPIRWDDIDVIVRLELDTAPDGCVTASAVGVRRLVEPAVEPRWILGQFDGARSIQEISLFAAIAPRFLVGQRPPRGDDARQLRELGIGYVIDEPGCLQIAIEPNVRLVRPGARRWYVQERIWQVAQDSTEVHALR